MCCEVAARLGLLTPKQLQSPVKWHYAQQFRGLVFFRNWVLTALVKGGA